MSRLFNQEFRLRLRKMAPWLISGGILGLDLVLHAPMFVLGAAIATLTVRIIKAIIKSNPSSPGLCVVQAYRYAAH
jgi:hypothetical protein